MSQADGVPHGLVEGASAEGSDSVELVSPVPAAMKALATAIQDTPGGLLGASIAMSSRGTLVFNRVAWELFEAALRRDVTDLTIVEPPRSSIQPLRFLLLTTSLPPPSRSD